MSDTANAVNVDDILRYFDTCFGSDSGKLHIASGWGIHVTDSGKFEHDSWTPTQFDYPGEAKAAANELARCALAGADVYVCPYLMHDGGRHKGAAKSRRILHADVDSHLDLEKINAIGGCVVISGSPDHGHVYVRLSREVTHQEHRALERSLVHYLGADPGKISENDVLRPPGTLNQKPTVSGDQPSQVMWLILPNGTVDPETVASTLGTNLSANSGRVATQIGSPEPINLGEYPAVLSAVARISVPSDRSQDTDHVVRSCYDSGLTLDQARWVVNTRKDLADRLANRPGTDDDVGRIWLKIDEERRKSAQSIAWIARIKPSKPTTTGGSSNPLCVEHLEDGFWDARESLQTIYTMAMARMCSPWATLACAAARALTLVRPHVTLPPIIGGPGSLNWFAALVDISGGGKSAARAAGRALVPAEHMIVRNLGSGEGVIGQFYRPATKDRPAVFNESVLFNVDEIDNMSALASRSGATLMPIIRQGFSGETLGFSYITSGRDVHLENGTYRLTMLISIQPERAEWLLADAAGGTPQRVMWFPASEPRISIETPWEPGPLQIPNHGEWLYPRQIMLPPEAELLIKEEHVKRNRGEGEALDGHALFCREKIAYALTVLDGRVEMNSEDWELSGIISRISEHVRSQTAVSVEEGQRRQAIQQGRLRGVSQEASDTEKLIASQERIERVLRWLLRKLGDGPMSGSQLQQSIASRDRTALQPALQIASSTGQIRLTQGGSKWEKV